MITTIIPEQLPDQDTDTFVVGVTHHFFNVELRRRRLALGLKQEECSVRIGLGPQRLGTLETFRAFPNAEEKRKISAFFNVPADRLFPAWIREWKNDIETITTTHEITPLSLGVGSTQLLLEGPSVEEELDLTMLKRIVPDVIASLTKRERQIIDLRFGLTSGDPMTLQDIGKRFGVTREVIRQVEARALKKLRHPFRAKRLRAFLGADDNGRPCQQFPAPFWEERKKAAK